jgi:integrase
MQWIDETGKRRKKSTGTTDKTSASLVLAAEEKRVALMRAGVIDRKTESMVEYQSQDVQSWIDGYVDSLEMSNGANDHTGDTRAKIEKIIAHAGLTRGMDLTAAHVVAYTTERMKSDKISARTVQSYLVAIKGFADWCRSTGRLASNPIADLRAPSPAKDRRYERRALSREEWGYLRRAAEEGEPIKGLTGSERALLYELALVTGLRSKEIQTLKRGSFILSDPAWVLLPGASTKNSKPAEQPITARLVGLLNAHMGRKMPGSRAFAVSPHIRLSELVAHDLAKARADWLGETKEVNERAKREATDFLAIKDHDGKVMDFHAMRYTCGAWLALAGIHAKQIQKLMRHSTIRLTLDTYGHLFPEQQDAALAALERATAV